MNGPFAGPVLFMSLVISGIALCALTNELMN